MAKLIINGERSKGTINRNIYGHFAEHLGRCIYGGLYVGEESPIPNVNGMRKDVVEALKKLSVPVLRWPGGCFADTYHWMDGIGPQSERKTIVNTNWGGVTENNSFGTHEFMELCRQLGCQPYLSGNVGSGTVEELSNWVEYCNMPGQSPMAKLRRENGREEPWNVKYWGIGNEAWGCGGEMRAEHYSDLCRQFCCYLRSYDPEHPLFKIACGGIQQDYHWTKTLMENAAGKIDAMSLHYYTVPGPDWSHKGSATEFDTAQFYRTLRLALEIETYIENHSRILRQYDPQGRVGLSVDEWGTWFDVEPGTNPGFLYQQNTMRDALVAAVSLNIFNNHCDTVVLAAIAQTVNVLQAMVLTEGERMLVTPTYHVFAMYREHQNARQLESYVQTGLIGGDEAVPQLHVSASQAPDGSVLVTAANLSHEKDAPVDCVLAGFTGKLCQVEATVLTGAMDSYNTFDRPETVKPQALETTVTEEGFRAVLPACSVAAFRVRL